MNITQLNATLDALSQATQRAEAAEARATELAAQLATAQAERDELRVSVANLKTQNAFLTDDLRMARFAMNIMQSREDTP